MSFLEMPLEEQVRNLQAQDVAHLETIIALECERDALRAEVERLKDKTRFTYCAYCGWKSVVDDHAEDLTNHVKTCERHPIRSMEKDRDKAKAEVERLKKELERVYSCLAEIWGGMMTNQEIIDKVVADALTRGEGLMYIDPKKFWKREPWYKRFWKWLGKS